MIEADLGLTLKGVVLSQEHVCVNSFVLQLSDHIIKGEPISMPETEL